MQNWELSKDGLPLNRINPLVQEADMFYDIVQVIPNEDYTVYVYLKMERLYAMMLKRY